MENFKRLIHQVNSDGVNKEKTNLLSTKECLIENPSPIINNYDQILKSTNTENDSYINSRYSGYNHKLFDNNSKIIQSIQASPIWKITSKIFSSPECHLDYKKNILMSPFPEEYKNKSLNEPRIFEEYIKKKEIKEYKMKKTPFTFNVIKIEKSIEKLTKKDSNIKKLKRLYIILKKIFFGDHLEIHDFDLKYFELEILNYVMHKKFNKKLSKKELLKPKQFHFERISKIITKNSCKRPEECFKFILTRAIKHLKKLNNFTKENFYRHYFENSSKVLNIDLANFYYPLTCNSKNKKQTLNAHYFEIIFHSQKFMKDLEKFLEIFHEEYKKEATKKIKDLLLKWDGEFSKNNKLNLESLSKIKNYIFKNSRCKLAWTNKEVAEAILRTSTLINFFKNKNK